MLADDSRWMRAAIEVARQGMARGQSPFGACIVRNDELVCAAHNQVWQTTDITAHAEMQAIRLACARLRTIDLSGCVIYSTCEPCPMCFAACHWARISKIFYGTSIAEAQAAGFNELTISNGQMKQLGGSAIEIVGGLSRQACAELFREWLARADRRTY